MSEKKKDSLLKSALKEFLDCLKIFIITFSVMFVVTHYFARPVVVKGSSMYPTLSNQDFGIANIIERKTKGIERFDIVIIYLEYKDERIVKRVIGLPGDTVECKEGIVYVNGEAIDEYYLNEEYVAKMTETYGYFTADFDEVVLGEDEYFCLGDNRPNSRDSRYYGPFTEDIITSKLEWLIYPFDHFGKIEE